MSEHELESIRLKKAEMMINSQSLPKDIIHINSSDEINKLMSDFPNKTIIIDFWAVWCAPCLMIAPIIEELANEKNETLKVAKIDVDNNPQTASKYGIRSIPTLLLFKNGEVVDQMIGAVPKTIIESKLEKHL